MSTTACCVCVCECVRACVCVCGAAGKQNCIEIGQSHTHTDTIRRVQRTLCCNRLQSRYVCVCMFVFDNCSNYAT